MRRVRTGAQVEMAQAEIRSDEAGGRRRGAGRPPARPLAEGHLPTPLYHQIYVLLREQIVNGVYAARASVPTEQELTRRYGVSRITAKRALDELAAEGLVVRRRGRGTRVIDGLRPQPVSGNISGLLENLLMLGLKTQVEMVDFGYVPASAEVAQGLQVLPGAEVQRAVRVRSLDGMPLSFTTSYVPAEIGRTYTRKDLARQPLLALLEKAGVLIGSADQAITATLADTVVAPRLKIRVGSPLISVTRTVADQNGRPVEYINILYRPDRYQYRMKLARVQGAATKLWSPTE